MSPCEGLEAWIQYPGGAGTDGKVHEYVIFRWTVSTGWGADMMKRAGTGLGTRNTKMMIATISAVVLLTTGTAAPWWRHNGTVELIQGTPHKTMMQLTGTAGGHFTGYYICNGKRTTVCGILPTTLTESGISQCEFRKVKPNDTLVLQVRDGGYYLHFTALAGTRGVRADTATGNWNAGAIKR